MSDDYLRLPAPAKLNLMLRVVGRRPDGYHRLQTVFQFIDLHDVIHLKRREDGHVRLLNPLPGVPENSDLTVRAALALQDAAGIRVGVDIRIEKNIPMGGGLGGGSSDAASVLLGLNRMWQSNLPDEQLAALGLRLGADVPVFLKGRSAWAEGVGECLTPMDLPEPWFVIVAPPCHISTAAIFNSAELTRDNKIITIADFLAGSDENHCLPVVLNQYPLIQQVMDELGRFARPRLTGTGACVFADFDVEADARPCFEALKARWPVFLTRGYNVSPLHRALDLQGSA